LDIVAVIVISGVTVGFALLLFVSILFKSAHSMVAEVSGVSAVRSEGGDASSEVTAVKSVGATEAVREESKVTQVRRPEAEDKKVAEKVSSVDAKILELRKKGLSIKKIAKEVGLSPSTVYRRLKKLTSRR